MYTRGTEGQPCTAFQAERPLGQITLCNQPESNYKSIVNSSKRTAMQLSLVVSIDSYDRIIHCLQYLFLHLCLQSAGWGGQTTTPSHPLPLNSHRRKRFIGQPYQPCSRSCNLCTPSYHVYLFRLPWLQEVDAPPTGTSRSRGSSAWKKQADVG
jgi:hypothetical protein